MAFKTGLVIGLGGYASVGPVLAARRLGIPSVLHEQNSVMGAANRFTAPPLILPGKAVRAGGGELASNPRARSAVLRVAERAA